jgi:hypothetical protein
MSTTHSGPKFSDQSFHRPSVASLQRGSLNQFLNSEPWFYAIGKILKNGWRNAFGIAMPNSWEEYLLAAPVATNLQDFSYTGPFFVRCDHGCSHGNESHATSSICEGNGFRPNQVYRRSELQIRQAGFVVAWIGVGDEGFETAYGSLVEIGIARSLGKPILLAHHPHANIRDFWFGVEAATAVVRAEDPLAALIMLSAEGTRR